MDAPLSYSNLARHPVPYLPRELLELIINIKVAKVARLVCRRWKEIAEQRMITEINHHGYDLFITKLSPCGISRLVQSHGHELQRLNAWKIDFPLVKQMIQHCPQLIQITINHGRNESYGYVDLQDLYQFPHLTNLTALAIISVTIGDAGAQHIVDSPFLTNLASLHLQQAHILWEGALAIAEAPQSSKLTRLILCRNKVKDAGATVIGLSTSLKNLRFLGLGEWNEITDRGAEALFTSSNLMHLTELKMDCNQLGHDSMRAIARSPYLTALRDLNLSDNRKIEDEGGIALAEASSLHLTKLDITWCSIRKEGIQALAQSPVLSNLRCFINKYDNFDVPAALAFVEYFHFHHLTKIDIWQNHLGDEGLTAIANHPPFTSLRSLTLQNNKIGDKGMLALAVSPYIQLEELDCGGNAITSSGLKVYLESSNARALSKLDLFLWKTDVKKRGPQAAQIIANSTQLMNLQTLDLTYNGIGDEGIYSLMNARCTNLMYLDLGNNGISYKAIKTALTSRLFQNLSTFEYHTQEG